MITVSDIEEILRAVDVEGLISEGAPDDEYDSEAADIALFIAKLPPEQLTEKNILEVIVKVWRESFELDDAQLSVVAPFLEEVARKIVSPSGLTA